MFYCCFRDTFIYAASAESQGLDAVVKVLGEVVLRPQISLQEVGVNKVLLILKM